MSELDKTQIIDLRGRLVNYSLIALSASVALAVFLYAQKLSLDIILVTIAAFFFASSCGFSIGNIMKIFEDEKDWLANTVEKYSSDWRGWYSFLFGMVLLMIISFHLLLLNLGIMK
jgi:ABC-type dipeptide/oligopeptide/nickel transport system permease component